MPRGRPKKAKVSRSGTCRLCGKVFQFIPKHDYDIKIICDNHPTKARLY